MISWLKPTSRRHAERRSATLSPADEAALGEQLARALTAVPIPTGAQERAWGAIERRMLDVARRPAVDKAGGWGRERRPARLLAATTLVVALAALGGLSPLGQQAIVLARETITITVSRIAPDGTRTSVQAEAAHIDNTVVMLNGMTSAAEAERQAGFPVRQPRDLPPDSRLLGANVITRAANTPGEWREVTLNYAVGDRLLRLTQALNRGVAPASNEVIAITAQAVAPAGAGAPTPQATTAAPSEAGAVGGKVAPLRKERQPVAVGSAAGTLETTLRPDGSVLDRMLTWKVGAMTYELSGPFSPDDLLAIARSI
jgi:hypothetical protein